MHTFKVTHKAHYFYHMQQTHMQHTVIDIPGEGVA